MNSGEIAGEREVSWKINLPFGPDRRALAVGLPEKCVVGLARSFGKVDCLNLRRGGQEAAVGWPDAPPAVRTRIRLLTQGVRFDEYYDCIAMGLSQPAGAASATELKNRLAPGGRLVCAGLLGCKVTSRWLRKTGVASVERWGAIPWGRPRVFFPAESRELCARALRFHVPGSQKARHVLAFAWMANRVGLHRLLARRGLLFCTNSPTVPPLKGLRDWVVEAIGRPLDGLVVYAGSSLPSRRITCLGISQSNATDVVIRVADTPQGEAAVDRECDALRAIADSAVGGQVPHSIWKGYCGGHLTHVQTSLPFGGGQVATLTDTHIDFLTDLATIGRTELPVAKTRLWHTVQEQAVLKGTRLPDSVRSLTRKCLSPDFAARSVVCHRVHGDFTPWNIRWDGHRPHVFDWETSSPDGLALTDLYHFLYQQSALIGPWLGGPRMLHLLSKEASRLIQKAGFPRGHHTTVLPLWLLLEHFNRPCNQIEELIGSYGEGTS
jgi:hypothetical protein